MKNALRTLFRSYQPLLLALFAGMDLYKLLHSEVLRDILKKR